MYVSRVKWTLAWPFICLLTAKSVYHTETITEWPPPPHTHTHGRIFQMPVLPNMHGLRRRVNWGDIKLSGLLDIPFKKSTKGEIPLTLPTLLNHFSVRFLYYKSENIYTLFLMQNGSLRKDYGI